MISMILESKLRKNIEINNFKIDFSQALSDDLRLEIEENNKEMKNTGILLPYGEPNLNISRENKTYEGIEIAYYLFKKAKSSSNSPLKMIVLIIHMIIGSVLYPLIVGISRLEVYDNISGSTLKENISFWIVFFIQILNILGGYIGYNFAKNDYNRMIWYLDEATIMIKENTHYRIGIFPPIDATKSRTI